MFAGTHYFAQFSCPHAGIQPAAAHLFPCCPYAHGEAVLLLRAAIDAADALAAYVGHQGDLVVPAMVGYADAIPPQEPAFAPSLAASSIPHPQGPDPTSFAQAPFNVAPDRNGSAKAVAVPTNTSSASSSYFSSSPSSSACVTASTTSAMNPHASLVATLTAMSKRLSSRVQEEASSATSPSIAADQAAPPSTSSAASVKKPLLLGRRKESVSSALRGIGGKSTLPRVAHPIKIGSATAPPPPQNLVPLKLPTTRPVNTPDSRHNTDMGTVSPTVTPSTSKPPTRVAQAPQAKRKINPSISGTPMNPPVSAKRARNAPPADSDLLSVRTSAHHTAANVAAHSLQPALTTPSEPKRMLERKKVNTGSTVHSLPATQPTRKLRPELEEEKAGMHIKGDQLKLAVEKHKRMMAERHGIAVPTPAASVPSNGIRQPTPVSTLPSRTNAVLSSNAPTAVIPDASIGARSGTVSAHTVPPVTIKALASGLQRSAVKSSAGSAPTSRLAKLRREMVHPRASLTAKRVTLSAPPQPTPLTQTASAQSTGISSMAAPQHHRSLQEIPRTSLMRFYEDQRQRQPPTGPGVMSVDVGRPVHQIPTTIGTAPILHTPHAAAEDEFEEVEYHELQGKARDIVPASRYPTVELCFNPKVPRAVRQTVLDKLLDEALRKHHFLDFALDNGDGLEGDAWIQAAIAEAVRLENEQYTKCQSKGVYMNLCAHAMQALRAETERAKRGD